MISGSRVWLERKVGRRLEQLMGLRALSLHIVNNKTKQHQHTQGVGRKGKPSDPL